MPQPTNLSNKSKKKVANSSGRIPAYNNTFAFRHNAKSKKTASILASPIEHCCRRCHEKIVWRKTYRKYKPLTQPATCNLCNNRNISAAYHTVCNSCSVSHPKALILLHEWNSNIDTNKKTRHRSSNDAEGSSDLIDRLTTSVDPFAGSDADAPSEHQQREQELQNKTLEDMDEKEAEADANRTMSSSTSTTCRYKRVCTVCFKQPALPDENVENDEDCNGTNKPMKLRQVKSLQRQREKQQQEGQQSSRKKDAIHFEDGKDDNDDRICENGNEDDNDDDDNSNSSDGFDDEEDEQDVDIDCEIHNAEEEDDDERRQLHSSEELHDISITKPSPLLDIEDDNTDDPFLQAIGGVQNLLVGEAYQKMLLEKNRKR